MIYNKFDIDIIKLEVLSTNNRAKNLYNKLGFKEIGISDEKIVRNEVQIESIIMELKK
jgi:ribosomal protein S18 acetylase RimI-like enzyme